MLYSLDFLDPGKPWLPPSEKERMKRYEGSRNLYEAHHDKVFDNTWRLIRQDKKTALEIVLNFPRRLSNLWPDLLVGEPPTYKTEADSTPLDDLVERGLNTAIRECGVDMSRFGDGLLKVRLTREGPVIEAVSPELWFPVVSRANVREIKHHVLAWTIEEETPALMGLSSTKRKYLYAEIHSSGKVEYRLMTLNDGGSIGPPASDGKARDLFDGEWRSEETHKASEAMLVVHVPNMRTTNRLHGHDDYEDIEGIVEEEETRLAQIARILDRHADPAVAGPPIVPPTAGSEEEALLATGSKYITVEPGATGEASVPQYITWDGNLSSAFEELRVLEKKRYELSETSPSAFGHSETGYAESGTSLKLRMQAPIAKASRLRTVLDPAVKEAIRTATTLAGKPVEAEIAWKDGLPEDDKERTEIEAQRQQARLSSRLAAIQRLYDLDEDAAREEMERIEEEGRSGIPGDGVPGGLSTDTLERSRRLLEGALGGTRGNGTEPPAGEPAE